MHRGLDKNEYMKEFLVELRHLEKLTPEKYALQLAKLLYIQKMQPGENVSCEEITTIVENEAYHSTILKHPHLNLKSPKTILEELQEELVDRTLKDALCKISIAPISDSLPSGSITTQLQGASSSNPTIQQQPTTIYSVPTAINIPGASNPLVLESLLLQLWTQPQ